MNRLLSSFFFVLMLSTVHCQEEAKNLTGPNVCQREKTFKVTKAIQKITPVTVESPNTCWPFRCTSFERREVVQMIYKNETEKRNVDECCEGYQEVENQCFPACSKGCENGNCTSPEKCDCYDGYTGLSCDQKICTAGRWGNDCAETCDCQGEVCDPFTGKCICSPGRIGENCELQCPDGKFGKGCESDCICENKAICLPDSGACICSDGYTGKLCKEFCSHGYYGKNCSFECQCPGEIESMCHPVNGKCLRSTEPRTLMECPVGYYGKNCSISCDCNGAKCDDITGECICPEYWTGEKCDVHLCPEGFYGPDCNQQCNCERDSIETNLGNISSSNTSSASHSETFRDSSDNDEDQAPTKNEELFSMASNGDYKSISSTCTQGVNMNITANNAETLLHHAAKIGNPLVMMAVIGCDININAVDEDGNTPLHVAVNSSLANMCYILLQNGADPLIANKDNKTAYDLVKITKNKWIHYMFRDEHLHWYNRIRKLDLNEKKMFESVENGYYGDVRNLCMSGTDVQIADLENDHNTVFHVIAFKALNVVPMVLTLVRCGADINARNIHGNTPLHVALMNGHYDVTLALLLNKANPLIKNYEGKTAIELAKESKDPSLQALLDQTFQSWCRNTNN